MLFRQSRKPFSFSQELRGQRKENYWIQSCITYRWTRPEKIRRFHYFANITECTYTNLDGVASTHLGCMVLLSGTTAICGPIIDRNVVIRHVTVHLLLSGIVLKDRHTESCTASLKFPAHHRKAARRPRKPVGFSLLHKWGVNGHSMLSPWIFVTTQGVASGHFSFENKNLCCYLWGFIMPFPEISENGIHPDLWHPWHRSSVGFCLLGPVCICFELQTFWC